MALLFADGFDHYADGQFELKWDAKVNTAVNVPTIAAGMGRCATQAMGLYDSWNYCQKAFPGGPLSSFAAGVAYNPSSGTVEADSIVIGFKTGVYWLCGVGVSPTQQLYAWTGTNQYGQHTALGYGTNPVRSGVYQYIEVVVTGISATTGAIQVWMNGVQEINLSNVETNGITLNGVSFSQAEAFTIGGYTSTVRTDYPGIIYYDDFYFTNTLGVDNTSYLGDIHVEELTPNADGFHQEWAALAAGDHFAEVDEIPPDDDTSYVHDTVVGTRDTYTYPSITPTSGTVYACVVNFYCKKITSGARAVKAITRLGGVDGNGTEFRVGNAYAIYQSVCERDPVGNVWTIPNVNSSEAGPEITF